ncbi:MAG: ATP-dependent DNA helicase [Verrucomicrobiae bacterium]|nr:ATP-dependent DNA helicase [Verrucomicrobiae bacterium]
MSADQKNVIRIAVRDLVEFTLRSGDISSTGFAGVRRAAEGTKGHRVVQEAQEEGYQAEVPILFLVEKKNVCLEVGGRIDGVARDAGAVVIEEIKTTARDPDDELKERDPIHWGQAKCYAFMYAAQNGLASMGVKLTYYRIDEGRQKSQVEYFPFDELKAFFDDLIERYLDWVGVVREWRGVRDDSIRCLAFPFSGYRRGQRELAVRAYRAARDGEKLFVQAPTGIGKTMATLFPAVKAMGEGHAAKIFYLTAKTITRTIAEKAFDNMRGAGLRFKSLTLAAKEKCCFCPEIAVCDPELCEFAKGYYDRVNHALREAFAMDNLTRPVVEELARRFKLCPFEFSLDLSLWVDGVICDYNHVLDPRAHLKRFFMEVKEDYVFLIDEAHNLVDRSREMFSAKLVKEDLLGLRRALGKEQPKIASHLTKVNAWFLKARRVMGEGKGFQVRKELPEDLVELVRAFSFAAERWLARNKPAAFRMELLDAYFSANAFLRVADEHDERHVVCCRHDDRGMAVKLLCLDPSQLLAEALKRGKAALFFSATLTPMEYFVRTLGGEETSPRLRLASPFPRENLCLLLDDRTSTKYAMRKKTAGGIAQSIKTLVEGRVGNYLAYFPSYQYMREVHRHFCEMAPETRTICQREGMTEREREEFLGEFSGVNERTLAGFAVMGGVFGEGIDLVGERLSGAVIVGVGLPQINPERDVIRDYFEASRGKGFEYAYVYPGMNKVLQAVGRVIRTETDRGVVLLIDERFSTPLYRRLCPDEWHPVPRVRDQKALEAAIRRFWRGIGLELT